MVQPNKLYQLRKLTDLDDDHVRHLAAEVHEAVVTKGTEERLRQRHLLGVIARHGASGSFNQSTDLLLESRAAMEKGSQRTYVIQPLFGSYKNRMVGLASIIPGLELREQPTPLPPAITRRVPGMSRLVRLAEPAANVAAWTWLDSPLRNQRALQTVYEDLAAIEPAVMSWTIEPPEVSQHPTLGIGKAIVLAGYQRGGTGYFDDAETRRGLIPQSELYLKYPDHLGYDD